MALYAKHPYTVHEAPINPGVVEAYSTPALQARDHVSHGRPAWQYKQVGVSLTRTSMTWVSLCDSLVHTCMPHVVRAACPFPSDLYTK
jgi:hypothetical protein